MPRGGLRSTSFKPGVSSNPGGRPKNPLTIAARRIFADVKALARACAPEAISTLKTVMLARSFRDAVWSSGIVTARAACWRFECGVAEEDDENQLRRLSVSA